MSAAENNKQTENTENSQNENVENTAKPTAKDIAQEIIKQKEREEAVKAATAPEEPAIDPIEMKNAEIAQLKDQLMRSMAEVENTRRRSRQQIEDASKYAVSNFAKDMINVLDNLYRASENIPEEQLAESAVLKQINDGVEMIKNELITVCEKHGINRIYPLDESFNPEFHQAVAHVPSPDKTPNTVIDVVQAGYTLKDRLLRPAMVAVAKEAPTE